jgi:hypothetical protein
MILFGLLMERQQQPGRADWSAFWFGSLIGMVPCVGDHRKPGKMITELREQRSAKFGSS